MGCRPSSFKTNDEQARPFNDKDDLIKKINKISAEIDIDMNDGWESLLGLRNGIAASISGFSPLTVLSPNMKEAMDSINAALGNRQ